MQNYCLSQDDLSIMNPCCSPLSSDKVIKFMWSVSAQWMMNMEYLLSVTSYVNVYAVVEEVKIKVVIPHFENHSPQVKVLHSKPYLSICIWVLSANLLFMRKTACFQLCDDKPPTNPTGVLNGLFGLRSRRIFSAGKGTLHPSVYQQKPKSTNLKICCFNWTGRIWEIAIWKVTKTVV